MIIKENDNNLLIENYQNKDNLSFLDIADNLEDHDVFIRIDNNLNIPILHYKNHKYIIEDCHIEQLESENRVIFKKI